MTATLDALDRAVAGWLAEAERPLVLGLCGAQGAGKSTVADALVERVTARGLAAAVLSLDDLYLSRDARAERARTLHPLFATRGVPGTHDVALGVSIVSAVRAGSPVRLPRFDKATDDPRPVGDWPTVGPLDLLVFEGWCAGAAPQPVEDLASPVNDLERTEDPDGVWRREVNRTLGHDYAPLSALIDRLVLLAAPGFEVVRRWRTEQEHELRRRRIAEGRDVSTLMSDDQIGRFIQHYERLTRHILRDMPGRADRVLSIDADRELKAVA